MSVPRLCMQSMFMAAICLGPVTSLQQSQAAFAGEAGLEHRLAVKSSDPRPTVHQLHPEQIQRSILRVLEQEMAGKVRAIHAVVVDPLDPIKIPVGDIGLRVSSNGVVEGLGRRAFHVQVNLNGKLWQTIDAIADVSASIDAVVPTRVIQVDSVVEAEDVAVHRVKLMDLDHQMITDVKDVIGKSAARPLQTNNPIRLGMVKKPYAVR